MDVSISIVTFNTKDYVKRCLASIFKHTKGVTFEVIVVDNGSTDGTSEMIKKEFPTVILIRNSTNKMFTIANNQSFAKAKGTYFLILNSDTFFVDNSVRTMVTFMKDNRDVGACEGLEIYEDGKLVPSGSLFSTPLIDFYELSLIGKRMKDKTLIKKYRMSDKKRTDTYDIDVGCDAFLMVKSSVFKEIGGYDQRFKLYYTENDLCYQIKKNGFRVVHLGSAKVMHKVSITANRLGWKKTDIYYHDLFEYYKKHGYIVSGFLLFIILKLEEGLLKILRPSL